MEAANYSSSGTLRNGERVLIRSFKPEDREEFFIAAGGLTAESLRRRFFGSKTDFSEAEQSFFLNPDFRTYVALIAVVDEAARPVIAGGVRYVVI